MKQLFERWNRYAEATSRYTAIEYNSLLAEELFSINEAADEEKSAKALKLIDSAGIEQTDAKTFHSSLTCQNQEPDTCYNKHPEMTAAYSIADLSKMKLYKVIEMNIGFALKEKGGKMQEIVVVHNNEPGVGGAGMALMKAAVRHGGCYLDHFDTDVLNNLYSSMGFEEYEKWDFDPQYVSDEFVEKYGQTDVILRKHKNCN